MPRIQICFLTIIQHLLFICFSWRKHKHCFSKYTERSFPVLFWLGINLHPSLWKREMSCTQIQTPFINKNWYRSTLAVSASPHGWKGGTLDLWVFCIKKVFFSLGFCELQQCLAWRNILVCCANTDPLAASGTVPAVSSLSPAGRSDRISVCMSSYWSSKIGFFLTGETCIARN